MDPKLAEDMEANARNAVELAKARFQVALDYRPESVQELEKLFDRVRYAMPDPESKETLGLLTRLWGSYLGEVIRRKLGGEWIIWTDKHGKTMALQVGEATVFPHNKVKKRLAEAEKEGIYLKVSGDKLDGDWLYIVVVPSKAGVRASEYANYMSKVERELRAAGDDNVLLVPALED